MEFRQLVMEADRAAVAGDHDQAAALLERALSLWRGELLADVPDGLTEDVRQTLNEERLAAAEAKLDAELTLHRYETVVRNIPALLAEHPYREHLYRRLMVALVGAGRRADALGAYQDAYRRFVDDLGVEPGPGLRQLERQILQGVAVDQPPARTAPAPRQLPPVNLRTTGRDKLLKDVADELRRAGDRIAPVVVLVGSGGVGRPRSRSPRVIG